MTGKAKIKLRKNAIATALKYITLAVYAAATSFVCLVVFISATGDFDRSTEGLLPLMPVGTEALYFVIVISVYAIVRMCGGGNLKIFYVISAVPIFLAYGSFVCRDFIFFNGAAGAASVLLTVLCAPLFFSSGMNLKGLCGITFVLLFLVIKIYFGRDNIVPLLISLHIVPPLTVIKLLIRSGQTEKPPRQTAV